MRHPREQQLTRYADDTLARRARARMAVHLIGCDRCRGEIARLRALADAVRLDREPLDAMGDRIAASRALGVRMVLPDGLPANPARRVRPAGIAVVGLVAVFVALLLPIGTVNEEGECMRSGIRKLLPVAIVGAAIACADEAETPADSLYSPIEAVDASRVLVGEFHYRGVMWTDGMVASDQGTTTSEVRRIEYDGTSAWRAVGESEGPFSGHSTDTTVFSAETLDLMLFVQARPESRGVFQRRIFGPDSIRQGYRMQDGTWSERSVPRDIEPRIMHWYAAHLRAFAASLPLTDGYLGERDGWRFRVVERVPVSVPAGNFETWRVDVSYGTWARYKVWVDVTQPLVVKVESGTVADRNEMVLTAYDLR